jgi:endonuclease-8
VSFHCHLGMDGSWRLYSRRPPINHRTRAILEAAHKFAVGQSLVEMTLVATMDEKKLVAKLGPDLLDPDWADEHLTEAARRLAAVPGRELGAALLDQSVMAGIGNVYKAELCFLLGVSPWSPVSAVDAEKTVALARKLLVRNALRPDRNTTGDPRRGRGLWVYGGERRGCLRCGGRVRVSRQGTRVAYYCPHCQPGPTAS